MMNKTRTRGRPRSETGARDAILAVARRRFMTEGYDRVSLRSIAMDAGVDVALISYHFGSKKGLFGAVLALTVNPAEAVAAVLAGPADTAPERLLRTFLTVWDAPEPGSRLKLLVQQAVRDPDVARLLREVVEREIVPLIAEHVGGADARHRAGAAISVITGLMMTRYLIGIEPVKSMPVDELVARTSPMLRAALYRRVPAEMVPSH